ncbi:MAG: hypothetical protein Q4D61_07580 [Cardiobacteriaceae bacterium]|nr:hypothetical protein [Cardiobacteriaceae bacterium]
MKTLLQRRETTLFLIILAASVIIGGFAPGFLSLATLSGVLTNALVLMTLTLGTMFVILTRSIDVSTGSILGLSAVILGMALKAGFSLPLAIFFCLGGGLLAGLINGILVAVLRIPAIIATLGTLGLYRSVMLMLTQGKWLEDLPQNLKNLNAPLVFGLSPLVLAVIASLVGAWFFLRHTRRGQYFYAVGDNVQAARNLGIPVISTQMAAFALSGLMAALGGLIYAAQIGFIANQAGNGLELQAIAANVLGGVSLLGGSGSVIGIVMSVLFLTSITDALLFLKIAAHWNDLIAGAILLVILFFDGRVRLFAERRMRRERYARQTGDAA